MMMIFPENAFPSILAMSQGDFPLALPFPVPFAVATALPSSVAAELSSTVCWVPSRWKHPNIM